MANAKGQALINEITAEYLQDRPSFRAGDTVKVYAKVIEGNRERIQVFEGVVLKRFMPRAKGNASQILKRTSHITVVVAER